jgi:crotonobetainyl-CoA:carnitine CoA-transferase CaiB-like acyl-CoA transferase
MDLGVLGGVKILDASTLLAAPMISGLLSDFGADVIKIEHPRHEDPLKDIGPYWKVTNRNKKCITLDFNQKEGIEIFYDLVSKSDVVVLNFRPDTLKKWKIDYEDLLKVKKDIIMMHFSAFGRTGPNSQKPGFARVAEAYSGFMYRTGYPDRSPVTSGYPLGDGLGGFYGAYSLMLALYHHQRTGEGQLIDLSLYEPFVRMMEDYIVDYDLNNHIMERGGTKNPAVAPNDIYKTSDGIWIVLPASTQNMFRRLMEVIGHPELIDDPKFISNNVRVENREDLDVYIKRFFSEHTAEELINLFEESGIAYGRVNNAKDIFQDQHIKERENIIKIFDEELNREITMQGIMPKLSRTPGKIKWPGPKSGHHNQLVYQDLLGYSEEQVKTLKENGVI